MRVSWDRKSHHKEAEIVPFCTCAFGIPVEHSLMTKKKKKKTLDGIENVSFLAKPNPFSGVFTSADKEEVIQGVYTGSSWLIKHAEGRPSSPV